MKKNKVKVLEMAKEKRACAGAYKDFLKAETKQERVNVVCGNLSWLFENGIVTDIDLPKNLKVGGSLYLRNTRITSLPENLKVGGSLDLTNTRITSLPENLKVGESICKDF